MEAKQLRIPWNKGKLIGQKSRLCNFISVKVGRQIHWEWGSGFHSQVDLSGHPVLIALSEKSRNKA